MFDVAPPPADYSRQPAATWVRHLNCATTRPLGAGRLVSHCLLVGGREGLLLVDTGLGTRDVLEGPRRFLAPYLWLIAPALDARETAIAQVRALGLDPKAVRDIAMTHLDLDHVGGLADFPWARVHVLGPELGRYRDDSAVAALARLRFAHGVRWAVHRAQERWLGLPAARLPRRDVDVRLVSLPGHTPGHAGVAVRDGARWLLHAGDAYLHRGELGGSSVPAAVGIFHWLRDEDDRARARTLMTLRGLAAGRGERPVIFSAHDAAELEARLEPEARFASIRHAGGPRSRL